MTEENANITYVASVSVCSQFSFDSCLRILMEGEMKLIIESEIN